MTKKGRHFTTGDCLIEVTTWADLAVYTFTTFYFIANIRIEETSEQSKLFQVNLLSE